MTLPILDKSSSSDESQLAATRPAFLVVGKLHRPHGVRGEMIMEVITDFPERLQAGITLYIGPGQKPLQLTSIRPHAKGMLVSFLGYTSPEAVGQFRNQLIYVSATDRPLLPEGEYYHHQIIGLLVISDQGEIIGTVTEILETGANDVFVIQPQSGAEILIPDTEEVVRKIDIAGNQMIIRLIPGLLPGEQA